MNLVFSKIFIKKYKKLPRVLKDIADKQLYLLALDAKRSSLGVKKIKGHDGLWEARINKNYRIIFIKLKDCYFVRNIGPHNILKNP